MLRRILSSALILLMTAGCSLYKSQGRRNFENDIPVRVPITAIFHCPSLVAVNEPDDVIEWQTLKSMYSDLTVHESIDNQTVVLLASSAHPQRTCISEGLDLADYRENFTF